MSKICSRFVCSSRILFCTGIPHHISSLRRWQFHAQSSHITGRGGVEDTMLEAKAKDTKKIRGQGQPFRGQTLSRPRTGMLEAKDQGHKRKCSPKKKKRKGLHKNFQAISKKKKKKWSSQKFFKRSPLKNVFQKIFQALHKILTFQKIVLSSSRGQANFRGLQNVSSRTPPPVTGTEFLFSQSNGLNRLFDRANITVENILFGVPCH